VGNVQCLVDAGRAWRGTRRYAGRLLSGTARTVTMGRHTAVNYVRPNVRHTEVKRMPKPRHILYRFCRVWKVFTRQFLLKNRCSEMGGQEAGSVGMGR